VLGLSFVTILTVLLNTELTHAQPTETITKFMHVGPRKC